MGIYGMGYITNYSLYNHYHTRSHKHRASCSAGPCVQHSTLAHGEQGSTQQSTTERRQSSEVAGCRLPCIHWKTLTAGRAHVGHKQTETRHRGGCFRRATHKENNLYNCRGKWLPVAASRLKCCRPLAHPSGTFVLYCCPTGT